MSSVARSVEESPSESHERGGPVRHRVEELDSVVVRFAGDSGDGMQLAGTQFTNASAIFGNDISTLPDFPAEIRAPAGTLAGVSGFQINFSSQDIYTPGDLVNTLVVMNPAALKTNLKDLEKGGLLIVNSDAFTFNDLRKADYATNPLEDGSLSAYRVIKVPINTLNREALKDIRLSPREVDRCKNFFALGLVYWLYERPLEPTLRWIREKFAKNPAILEANTRALKAGYNFGETTELFPVQYRVPKAHIKPGTYRKITGNEATALGLVTASILCNKTLIYCSYPITPASDILHALAEMRRYGVRTFQAEDEIAAVGAAIGASFGGALGVTGSSGPGLCLKSEAIGLAVMVELPLVVIDVQRGGPSTGLPTKTEQADLLQALFGRNGESPVAVVAPCSPADCFDMIIEAVRIALRFMTPVILLSDGYLGNGAEPWLIPDVNALPRIEISHPTKPNHDGQFMPYLRDERLVRQWALPGTPGLEHRIGGLEKEDVTGNVSYDPINHEKMVRIRAQKVANIANEIPPLSVNGPEEGDLLVIGWGGTFGSITTAVNRARRKGLKVASAHLRYLNPMPKNTGEVLRRYKRVLVPELNCGQLLLLLRGRYLVDAVGLNKIQGKPFLVSEIESEIYRLIGS
ncbi:MAG: 2-oxoacid:acceptor oxidoreductase subunit alpha [Gemmatales bacterium]|nr:2-oxoacid:acceptor oxidoreductase subunit alpha [Gemmatales bacterium]MDW8386455.1 2-oxoacid:acceptor oxidoreductase subunit alpha [Gemmatales bacterium]